MFTHFIIAMTTPDIPENFRKVIGDFVNDLSNTFPEYTYLWTKWVNPNTTDLEWTILFKYVLAIYPKRFFDILYQNDEIFASTSEINTNFLPNTNFKLLFHCEGISENTKQSIWKYLQLVLFTIIGSVEDKSLFGETANLFDGVNEGDLQEKLSETMQAMSSFFTDLGKNADGETGETNDAPTDAESSTSDDGAPKESTSSIPNIGDMQEHLRRLFDGKIGKLAKEMAEELTSDLTGFLSKDGVSEGDLKDPQQVIKKLMKNPKKMMDLVKSVGSKLNSKMESGEINKEELMKEAGELLGKMKEMGGGAEMNDMFKNLAKQMGGMGGMGKNVRVDVNAMNNMMKSQNTRDRLRKKVNQRKQDTPSADQNKADYSIQQKSANEYVFTKGEKQEKSVRPPRVEVPEKSVDEVMAEFGLDKNDTPPPKKTGGKKSGKKNR
jgi:hypothetical protein